MVVRPRSVGRGVERKDLRRDLIDEVAIMRDQQHRAGKSVSALCSTSSVSKSKSLVGSSRTMMSAGCSIKRAINRRLCSPPDKVADAHMHVLGAKQEALEIAEAMQA